MQTFLPFPSFFESLNCLDRQRLCKQRVESWQIINILQGKSKSNSWKNHPAVKMWCGYANALKLYYNTSLSLWEQRGYKNIKLQPLRNLCSLEKCWIWDMPPWFGDMKFHISHQSNLLRKNKEYYS